MPQLEHLATTEVSAPQPAIETEVFNEQRFDRITRIGANIRGYGAGLLLVGAFSAGGFEIASHVATEKAAALQNYLADKDEMAATGVSRATRTLNDLRDELPEACEAKLKIVVTGGALASSPDTEKMEMLKTYPGEPCGTQELDIYDYIQRYTLALNGLSAAETFQQTSTPAQDVLVSHNNDKKQRWISALGVVTGLFVGALVGDLRVTTYRKAREVEKQSLAPEQPGSKGVEKK
jgi:hypothetical protein